MSSNCRECQPHVHFTLCPYVHGVQRFLEKYTELTRGYRNYKRHMLWNVICLRAKFVACLRCPKIVYTHLMNNYNQMRCVLNYSWASYQIRKIAGCACAGNAGNVFPRRRFQRKPLVSDPGMHHGTCVTHVPWCMSGSLTRGDGENGPGFPGACAPTILRIWQEAHGITTKMV